MTSETNQPTEANAQPELKQVLGALLFAARKPITVDELHGVLAQAAQNGEDDARSFGKIRESDIRTALEQVKTEMAARKLGLILVEVAGGFRFQTDPSGGPWVRKLLNLDKPARLSKPALETLAIIAYRQPATRAEIEALRGVNVDAMMRHLLELQLIRIMGRSDLPGRPLMYGTTQLFLEHFGLSSVKNLPGVEQLSRRDAERVKREANTDLSAIALATAEHPTLLRPSASEGKLPNAQCPMEEQTAAKEDGGTMDDGQQKTEEANAQRPTPNSQCRMEERTEDGSAEGTNADKEVVEGKDQDEAEKTEPEEEEEEEDDEDDEDEDEDEDDEGRK